MLKELHIDFTTGPIDYRRRHATVRGEAIARAFGLKKNFRPVIIDATAGLGNDSFILAALGCEVYLYERAEKVYTALKKGLAHAKTQPELLPIVNRLHLIHGDSILILDKLPIKPDAIYLDPMFPNKTKSAAPRQDMQALKILAGKDQDADKLLSKAISCCVARVVVKRPRLSCHLGNLTPSFTLKGNSCRFDVYIKI